MVEKLEDLGFDNSILTDNLVYIFNKKNSKGKELDPYKIKNDFYNDFYAFFSTIDLNDRQKKKIELFKKVVIDKSEINLETEINCLTKANKDKIMNLKEKKELNQESLEKVLGDELLKVLESKGNEKHDDYTKYRKMFTRYRPSVYDKKTFKLEEIPEYKLYYTRDIKKLQKAAEAAESCLTEEDIKSHVQDPGIIYLVLEKDGKVSGYERFMLTFTHKLEPVLAIDTMEIGNKDWENNKDALKVMGLVAAQFCLDLNAKYAIINDDGRVKYGPKQAFGNQEMKVKLKKFGKNYEYCYGFYNLSNEEFQEYSGVYVLMQNWKIKK